MIAAAAGVVILSREELDAIIRDAARAAVAEAAKHLHPGAAGHESELWTAQQIADHFNVSAYTVAYTWAPAPNFPAAVVLGEGPKAPRRWYRKEIEEWQRTRQTR